MLTDYINAALRHARYEILSDDGSYYGETPELPAVWANAETLEACREELREALENWITLGLAMQHKLPPIDDVEVIVEAAS